MKQPWILYEQPSLGFDVFLVMSVCCTPSLKLVRFSFSIVSKAFTFTSCSFVDPIRDQDFNFVHRKGDVERAYVIWWLPGSLLLTEVAAVSLHGGVRGVLLNNSILWCSCTSCFFWSLSRGSNTITPRSYENFLSDVWK